MIDLSHHNGPVDFRRLFQQAGQRRVYLKRGGVTSRQVVYDAERTILA